MKIKDVLLPTLALLLICVVVAGALSATNRLTRDTIAAAEQAALQEAMEQLIPNADYTDVTGNGTVFAAHRDGLSAGHIILTEAMGYKSTVSVMTAINSNGEVMNVIVTNCSEESPGIGQKVATDNTFLSQFAGIATPTERIDAITGATYSSDAVTEAVNKALTVYQTLSTVTATDMQGGAAQ